MKIKNEYKKEKLFLRRCVFLILSLMLVGLLSGCNQNEIPSLGINRYVYEQIKKSPNHEIKLEAENIYMVNEGHYEAKVYKNEDKGKDVIPTYDINIYASGYAIDGGETSDYEVQQPYVYYTKEDKKYILIKENGWTHDPESLSDSMPLYSVKIYVPENGLDSIPNNRGKFGTDENKKIS